MIHITLKSLSNLLKTNLFNSPIKICHIFLSLSILSIIVILALIPFYLKKNTQIEVQIRVYRNEFHIRWFNGSPDGYERAILSINDQFPAPRIIVDEGDLINITIINESDEETSIHWHGLHQRNSLDMDGVPGVTQCPILPNERFLYQFSTINQSGTYWYHSHSAIQYGDGLKGILIIKDRNDPWKDFYEDEDIIELTDWYHLPASRHLKSYLYPGTLDPIPDTILINAIGQFNCSLNETCSFYRTSIKNQRNKRFRLINTSVYARITIHFDQHQMRLIEVDGIYLDGNTYLQTLRLSPGQRYSVLIQSKENVSENFWIRATIHPFVDYNNQLNYSTQPTALAILQYNNNRNIPSIDSINNNDILLLINQSLIDGEIFSDQPNLFLSNSTKYILPNNDNIQTLVFNSQHHGDQPGYFYMNNQTFIDPTNQTLLSLVLHQNDSNQFQSTKMIQIEKNQIIDLILNNIDFAPHPFHLHGHHLWILKLGNTSDGYFNQSMDYNITNPIYRDTFTINPFSYAIVRFQTDNPGIWIMHCHNDWHLNLGMALVFIESQQLIKQFYSNQNIINSIPSKCQHLLPI